MATYTENYNLKMPSGQDAPDVEDFNTNAEIIDTVLKAHSDNTADEYSPDETYTAGRLVIQNNALWKAKQDISVAETWTPDHWDPTTLAAELSSLNSSIVVNEFLKTQDILEGVQSYVTFNEEMIPDGYSVITAWCTSEHPSSVLCGGPYVEKNMAIAPYIANQPEQGEKFHLYIALKRS